MPPTSGRQDDRPDGPRAATPASSPAPLYANWLDADSTKPARVFESSLLMVGVTWGF